MYLPYTPRFLQQIFPEYIWHVDGHTKTIYLTFDDGPVPEVTPWTIDLLKEFNAKASFFCVGQNIERHTKLFHRLQDEGHTVGNHTFSHLSGWATDNLEYIRNVRQGARISGSKWFRPPYGRLKPSQARFLKQHYKIVMWDVLSGDFDPKISDEQCYQNVVRNTGPGSIVVFHDSLKSKEKMKKVLPRVLAYFQAQGYGFENLGSMLARPHRPLQVESEAVS